MKRQRIAAFCCCLFALLFAVSALLGSTGVAAFLLGTQKGVSSYDYTVTLTKPQAICVGAKVDAHAGRIYVFSEDVCALNVYAEDGTFLFAVRGNRAQNGQAAFYPTEDEIYIKSRNDILYRFGNDGNYQGRAGRGWIYNADDLPIREYQGDILLWGETWYCYSQINSEKDQTEFYLCINGEDRYVGTAEDFAATEDAGSVRYFTILNGLYRKENGHITKIAKAPFYLTLWYSPFLAWGAALLGWVGSITFLAKFKIAQAKWKAEKKNLAESNRKK